MRSRAERLLRTGAWAAVAGLLFLAARPPARPSAVGLEAMPGPVALARLAIQRPADTLVVSLADAPGDTARAALAALAGAGMAVRWHDRGVPARSAEAELDAVTGTMTIRAAGGPLAVSDAIGPLGIVDGALTVPMVALPLSASVRPAVERVPRRGVVLYADPGWEGRWVARALEAEGWDVTVVARLAPEVVTPGPPLDTVRVGAVLVLARVDESVGRAIARFVRGGGGVVLAPAALATRALADLAPGAAGAVRSPVSLALPATRSALPYRPVTRIRADAVPLEGDRLVARVAGAGRVVQSGETATWRWALASEPGQRDHASYWSRVVEAARYRPLGARVGGNPAPRAALVAALGAPIGAPGGSVARLPWEAMLFVVALAGLLGEWALRRRRGAA